MMMKREIIDPVFINTTDEGNHHFYGEVKLFGHIFSVEGNTYNYKSHTEFDEYGNPMWTEVESELEIDGVWSGRDCEVEYHCSITEAIKERLS
jgi:hypothetical protein